MQDSLIGAVVDGRYAITALIGRGGMATVYRARDKRLERDIAIKLMHPHLAEKPDLNARFNKEARAAAQLTSPNLVAIHDQGVWASPDGPRAYLVMEYVPGPDVRSELQRLGSFTLGTSLALTEQILHALGAAHKAGIVHRDIKPENVLLLSPIPEAPIVKASEIQAKVADFGLAHVVDAETSGTGTILGTVAYIPPEAIGSGTFSPPADLYSLGIVLYEFLTGTFPFHGETPMQTAYMHMNDPLPRVDAIASWIPPQVDAFIARLAAKDPRDRPADATAALAEFIRMRDSLPEETLIRRIPVAPTKSTPPAQPAEPPAPGYGAPVEPTRAFLHGSGEKTAIDAAPPTPQAPVQVPPAAPSGGIQATTVDPAAQAPARRSRSSRPSGTAAPTPRRHARARRRRQWPAILLLLALLAVAGGGGAWYFLEGPGKRVQVPAVAGVAEDHAEDLLQSAGFAVERAEAYSDEVPAGTVISSSPEAGSSTKVNSSVRITVSLGIEQVTVPDVLGKPENEALAALEDARVESVSEQAFSEEVEAGLVISQSVEPGTKVDHDSAVSILVSKGRQPLPIPAVTGKSKDEATGAIEGAGFTVSPTEAFSDSVPAGQVISQSPAEGTGFRGDAISIVVSKGPETVQVPNVTDLSLSEAQKKLADAGLQADVSKPFGMSRYEQVWMQSPASGTTVHKGSSVKLTVI